MKTLFTVLVLLLAGPVISNGQNITYQDSIPEKPFITVGGLPPGRMPVTLFKKQTKIIMPQGYTLKKTIVSVVIPAQNGKVEKFNLYSTDLSPLQEVMSRCIPGTVVYFEKIFTQDEKGQSVFLRNTGYALF
jgi:hypothetical protein